MMGSRSLPNSWKFGSFTQTFCANGGWVLLKFALGWQASMSATEHHSKEERSKIRREYHSKEERSKIQQGSMLAMIGNVLSFAVAAVVGWVLNPDFLNALHSK